MDKTQEYEHLQVEFGRARRRWKRAAALAGLALVLLESVGIVTLVILLSLFYGHIPWARYGLFTAGAAAIVVLTVRHIVRPLLRRIPDEQIALYAEEHDAEFEGALVTAAEFGRKAGISPLQNRMIQAVVHAADSKAASVRLTSLVSFARLQKYGVAAAVCLVVYIVMCVVFPATVGRHVVAALQPWRVQAPTLLGPDGRGLPSGLTAEQARMLVPIEFALSGGDVRLARGEDFRLEARLSREPQEGKPVLLQFRSVGDREQPGEWQHLPMDQIEKLHGYARRLDSVSEDMEFRVAAEEYVSQTHRITVYDKIELRAMEIVTTFPAYLGFPDRVDALSNGDVSAPIGSTVTVRIVVNTELASGKLMWDGGKEQPLTVDPQRKGSATASFPVEAGRQYRFEVTDVDGQVARSLGPSEVFALKDNPPTLDLIDPTAEVEIHALGEVDFFAKVTDDFGVAKADLVYLRFTGAGEAEGRVALALTRPDGEEIPLPEVVDARLRWLLENVEPKVKPGEVISWYVEARDRKPDNPAAISDLHTIVILPFEMWGAYQFEPAGPPHDEPPQIISLAEVLMEVWAVHRVRETLTRDEYAKKCDHVADMMVDPATGEVLDFGAAALPPHPSPRMVEAAKKAQAHAEKAYDALLQRDTLLSSTHLRLAIAELIAAGIADTEALLREGEMPEGAAAGGAPQQASRLMEMFADVKAELEAELGSKIEGSLGAAEAAAQARQAVEDIRGRQERLINAAMELSRSGASDAAKSKEAGKLGKTEQSLAHRARAAANALKSDPAAGRELAGAADKIDAAAGAMRAAASHLGTGEVSQAITNAVEADKLLGAAEGELKEKRLDQLGTALGEAESAVEALLRDQGQLRRSTDRIDGEAGGKPLTPKQKRDLKKLSFGQVKLKARLEAFDGKMTALRKWASDSARTDTTQHVQAADRTLKRTQPGQKMANAVVELAGFQPKAAAGEQRQAEAGLAKALAEIRGASDTLAATREEALRRAVREAKAVREDVEQIARADPTGKGKDPAGKGEDAAGKGEDTAGKGEDAGGKGEDTAGKGEDAAGKGEDAAGKGGEASGQGSPLTPGQRREIGKKVAAGVRRLTRQLQSRSFGLTQDVRILTRVAQDESLEAKLVTDPATQKRLGEIVGRVTDKLEAELEATTRAQRVHSARSEHCPPQYRHLVNKYYEALSRKQR